MWAQKQQIMAQDKVKKIHLIYGCILLVLLIAVGIALIVSCLDIYHSGDRPYSPASIGAHFRTIAVLVYVTVAAVIGGIVLDLALPLEQKRPKAVIDEMAQLHRQQKKAGTLTGDYAARAAKEQKLRSGLKWGTGIVFAILMIYPLIYFTDIDHFTIADLNADIIKALVSTLIPAVVGLGLCFGCKQLCGRSLARETELWKTAIAEGSCAPVSHAKPQGVKKLTVIRGTILAIAAVSIIVGIFNGGAADVLLKAIAICTECIGLG